MIWDIWGIHHCSINSVVKKKIWTVYYPYLCAETRREGSAMKYRDKKSSEVHIMSEDNWRRYVRVRFEKLTDILFVDSYPIHNPIINLSLSGMFIEKKCELENTNSPCTITFAKRWSQKILHFVLLGNVVRTDRSGIAINFTEMTHNSFVFLQTLLLYEYNNPVKVGEEFLKPSPFAIVDSHRTNADPGSIKL